MATTAIIAGAVIGAAGNYMSAKEGNKPRNSTTNQTTTNKPWMWNEIGGDVEAALDWQRAQSFRGVPQIGPDGSIYYSNTPGFDWNVNTKPWEVPGAGGGGQPPIGGGGGGVGGGQDAKSKKGGGGGGGTWVNKQGVTMMNDPRTGKPVRATGGGPGVAAPPRPMTAEDMYRDVYDRGVAAGDSPTVNRARDAMGNILGAAGGGGPERTGFDKYNPILDRLAQLHEGDASNRVGQDLLLSFLNENQRGGAGGAGGGAGGGGGRPTRPMSYGPPAYVQQMGGAAGGPGGIVPDTMAQPSFFADETRKIFDEQANTAEIEALIHAMNEDVEKGMFRDLAQLDAAAQGSGRFGGDMWKGMSGDAREEALQEMLKNASGVRLSENDARRQARLAALGQVNTRDLSAMGDLTDRASIAANERAAGASASASAAAAAEQAALARRGQDLSALGLLMENEQFGLGQLGSIGSQLSGDRLATLGLTSDIEGIGLQGLGLGLGAGQGMTDLRRIASDASVARGGLNLQRQDLDFRRQLAAQDLAKYNVGQGQNTINQYLDTLRAIGGMGGESYTQGRNVVPGAGGSPWGAAAMGALGGAAAGYGMFGGGGGYGTGVNYGTGAGGANYGKPPKTGW